MLKASPHLPRTLWIKVKGRITDEQMKTLEGALRGKVNLLRAPHSAGKHAQNAWYGVELPGARRGHDPLERKLREMSHPVEKMKRVKLGSLEVDTVARRPIPTARSKRSSKACPRNRSCACRQATHRRRSERNRGARRKDDPGKRHFVNK